MYLLEYTLRLVSYSNTIQSVEYFDFLQSTDYPARYRMQWSHWAANATTRSRLSSLPRTSLPKSIDQMRNGRKLMHCHGVFATRTIYGSMIWYVWGCRLEISINIPRKPQMPRRSCFVYGTECVTGWAVNHWLALSPISMPNSARQEGNHGSGNHDLSAVSRSLRQARKSANQAEAIRWIVL